MLVHTHSPPLFSEPCKSYYSGFEFTLVHCELRIRTTILSTSDWQHWCDRTVFCSVRPFSLCVVRALSWPLSSGIPSISNSILTLHRRIFYHWDINWRVQAHMHIYGCFLSIKLGENCASEHFVEILLAFSYIARAPQAVCLFEGHLVQVLPDSCNCMPPLPLLIDER